MKRKPKASRPYMPEYGLLDADKGKGLLPWSWAEERLIETPYYWLGTTRPDSRPHSMPIWAIYVDDIIYFSTGHKSRKAKNLQENPECAVSVQIADQAVIVEGRATRVKDAARIKRLSKTYKKKYKIALDPKLGPIYGVRPKVVFGFIGAEDEESAVGDFIGASTRWTF